MAIHFFNTLSRRKEEFVPLVPGQVRMYTCGPTVHDFSHIGNFRTFVFEDLLRRYLKYRGYAVTQVMNITDIEDKIIRKARQRGVSVREVTEPYIQAFFEDLGRLNVERAEHYPRATEHVEDMVALIRRLLEKGYAYRSEDGSIYYDISRFPDYGRLAHIRVEELRGGARVRQDEYDKEDVADFALWKAWDPEDGEVYWDQYPDLGKGRPGWHIECSAMSMHYLGEHFDIHTGGVDNIFPHHQNEIAQSEAATGVRFANYWLHAEHLQVEGQKMAKSLGNFFTLRDLVSSNNPSGRAWDPLAIRYVYLGSHYRSKLNFTFSGLRQAESSLDGLKSFVLACREVRLPGPPEPDVAALVGGTRERFVAAMDDDLSTPPALAALFDLVGEVNRRLVSGRLNQASAGLLLDFVEEIDRVLGLRLTEQEQPTPEEMELIARRQEARRHKDWATADRLRAELASRGVILEDTPQGVRWKIDRKQPR
jgi:cysteinyl-tRNA synthetase